MGVIKGHNVTLIAESSTTRTEWSLIDNGEVLAHAYTQGLNPFFMTRREISHSIRLEPRVFLWRRLLGPREEQDHRGVAGGSVQDAGDGDE